MTRAHSSPTTRGEAILSSLASTPPPRATGPGPEEEDLRRAYLDLLKLCLADLVGPSTVSVGPVPDGTVVARELRGDELRSRAAGVDWPLQGLTMTSQRRLADLQACVRALVDDGVAGDVIEAGSWRGGSSMLMRATLDSIGEQERTVWVADSFQGFRRGAQDGDEGALGALLSAYDFLAVSEDDVRESFARLGLERGVRFVPGFFEETLPRLRDGRWALLRLDGDTYEATSVALRSLYGGLADGGFVILDDYGVAEECQAAVDDFRRERGIQDPLEVVDWTCVRWRRGGRGPAPAARDAAGEVPAASSRSLSVPTVNEVELTHQLAQARAELADARARLDHLRRYEEAEAKVAQAGRRLSRPLRSVSARRRG